MWVQTDKHACVIFQGNETLRSHVLQHCISIFELENEKIKQMENLKYRRAEHNWMQCETGKTDNVRVAT